MSLRIVSAGFVFFAYGLGNALSFPLSVGATVVLMAERPTPAAVFKRLTETKPTLFFGVPTMYARLAESERLTELSALRLAVSGSAPLAPELWNRIRDDAGVEVLERYGMTEIGMALSNPYVGERRAGMVGLPLPGVEAALFDDANERITSEDQPGEIRIRGAPVFLEYWNNPQATAASFHDGWFCTGDVAVLENGYFRILGRSSIDIIKSGGYKLSALEIEGTLLTHDMIAECAVVGVEDETWGEAVTACVVLKSGQQLSYQELKSWCESRMSPYKIPKQLRVMSALPRNAMGKVLKAELKGK